MGVVTTIGCLRSQILGEATDERSLVYEVSAIDIDTRFLDSRPVHVCGYSVVVGPNQTWKPRNRRYSRIDNYK